MKTRLLFLFLSIVLMSKSFAQTVSIPDPNFEQALINIGIDSDGIINGQILTSDTDGVTAMDVSASNIFDLSGIEAFGDLMTLICYENNLTTINTENNSQLVSLYCYDNPISSLDLSQNLLLQTLDCSNNQLTSLDVSLNTALVSFNCKNNLLTSLNVKNGNNTSVSLFDSSTNEDLICIEVDDDSYSITNWINIDAASSFDTDCATFGLTYVPDDNFEQALIDLGYDSGALDDYVSTANIDTVVSLDISFKNITDLTGIGDFVVLADLNCRDNLLTSLDFSQNSALTTLNCMQNQLTSLDVTQNSILDHLNCGGNQLISLDVTQNPALTLIASFSNPLNSLDLTQNTALTTLNCIQTQLTSLDVSQNINLTILICFTNPLTSLNVKNGNNTNFTNFSAQNNPNLNCIEVDDAAWSAANWFNIHPASSFNTNCANPETYVPDDNFENYLETHDANGTVVSVGDPTSMGNGIANDDYVTTAAINTVTNLAVINLNIFDLTGIEDFVSLTLLNCQGNQLTSLNLSQNITLSYLGCPINQLTSLDLTQNIALTYLSCHSNQLTSLDLSQNVALVYLRTDANQLTSLNVKNGNNTNVTQFLSYNNPNLLCIQVDSPSYSTANWFTIDPASSFNTNCSNPETYVPDDNFENYLETHDAYGSFVAVGDSSSMGNGIANDDYVTTANISSVTHLHVYSINITDLTGIEDFVALQILDCGSNQLSSLNITQNTALTTLNCGNNQLSSLNITQNTALTALNCSDNLLTNSLDISQNISLNTFDVSHNQLTALDASQNVDLIYLYCHHNQLTNLNVTQNVDLIHLLCHDNQLTSLNVKNGNNTNLTAFNSTNNPNLNCIEVDDASWSTANWTNKDPSSTFVNNQTECNVLSSEEVEQLAYKVYPNPSNGLFTVKLQNQAEYNVIDINGRLLKSGRLDIGSNQLDMRDIPTGIYFLQLKSEERIATKKLIKH